MVYNYISTHFYAICLVLYASYKVNLETFTFFVYFTMLLPLYIPFQWQTFKWEVHEYMKTIMYK
jgi:hypothetical protein